MFDRTSHPEKCPQTRTSHTLSGIAFRTHFRTHFHTHIARAKVRYYAHVCRKPTSGFLGVKLTIVAKPQIPNDIPFRDTMYEA